MSDESRPQLSDSSDGAAIVEPLQIQLLFEGHLSEWALAAELTRAEREMLAAKSQPALVVNCLTMTGYEPAARAQFVSWNSRHKRKFLCVAVLTENKLWHMVVSSMALATGQKMKPFNALDLARPWIAKQWPQVY